MEITDEHKQKLLKFLKRTIKVIIFIAVIKFVRYYIIMHRDDLAGFVVGISGVPNIHEIIKFFILLTMIINLMILAVLTIWQRWKVLDSKLFLFIFFMELDLGVFYFFPEIITAAFGYH